MRRGAALAVAAVLALAACGGDDGDRDASPTTAAAEPSTAAPGAPGPTEPATTPPDGGGDGATPTTAAPPASSITGDGAAWPALDGAVPVGAFAPSLLRPDRSARLVLEVHADAAPADASVAHVRSLLADASGKPVDVVEVPGPGGGERAWTSASLRDAAAAGAATAQGDGTAVVRLLFLRGTYEGEDGVLGVAVQGDVAAVFVDRVADAAGLFGNHAAIEESVAAHELGHLLGLVDLVLDTGRADPEHPGHSPNRGSVMYWAVESDLIGQLLGARPPRDFDDADRRDLAAIRDG